MFICLPLKNLDFQGFYFAQKWGNKNAFHHLLLYLLSCFFVIISLRDIIKNGGQYDKKDTRYEYAG